MSPEQITILTSLVSLVKMLSSWPMLAIILAIIVGPWVMSLMIADGYRKRFEQVVKMYESNVRLVEKYECLADDLKDVVIMNTQSATHLADVIKANNSGVRI